MTFNRLNWVTITVVLAMACMAVLFGQELPDPVPTHWNLAGEADRWTPKPWGIWLFPALGAGLLALLLLLPVISPKGFRLDNARRAYDIIVLVIMGFLAGVQALSYRVALGEGPDLGRALPLMIGFLFIVLGNYLGKFPKNFFVGIRTPWTLASDEVWNRTHRLGGWTFMLAGLALVISGFYRPAAGTVILASVLAAGIPVVYSLLLYRKLVGFGADED